MSQAKKSENRNCLKVKAKEHLNAKYWKTLLGIGQVESMHILCWSSPAQWTAAQVLLQPPAKNMDIASTTSHFHHHELKLKHKRCLHILQNISWQNILVVFQQVILPITELDAKPLCCSAAVDTTISSMSGHHLCASRGHLDDWGNSQLQFILPCQYTCKPTTNSTYTDCSRDICHRSTCTLWKNSVSAGSARTFGSLQCALTQLSRKSSSTGNVRPGLTDPKAQNKSMHFSDSG